MTESFLSACAQRAMDSLLSVTANDTTVGGQHQHIVLAHVFVLLELEALLQCEAVSGTWHDVVAENEDHLFGQLLRRMREYDSSALVHLRHLAGNRARPGPRWDVWIYFKIDRRISNRFWIGDTRDLLDDAIEAAVGPRREVEYGIWEPDDEVPFPPNSLSMSHLFKNVGTPRSLWDMLDDPAADNCMAAIGRALHLCGVLHVDTYEEQTLYMVAKEAVFELYHAEPCAGLNYWHFLASTGFVDAITIRWACEAAQWTSLRRSTCFTDANVLSLLEAFPRLAIAAGPTACSMGRPCGDYSCDSSACAAAFDLLRWGVRRDPRALRWDNR